VTLHLGGAFERAVSGQVNEGAQPALEVLYEDDHLLTVVKPAGVLTAPTPEGDRATLWTYLSESRSPLYVVHRLDLQTSGVLVFAKSKLANQRLSEVFRRHDLRRCYDVFVVGQYPRDEETIRAPIDGKDAVTHLRVASRAARFTRLEATLETGRTHQIRRHLASRNHPVLGDPRYGTKVAFEPPRMALHARLLEFEHPVTGAVVRTEIPLPDDLGQWFASQA
jgi:23S rRNA pseudouridine1911/1915/1917 synthase